MNQVPFSFPEPFFDLGHSLGGGASIGRYSVQVHFSFKQGSGGEGVPDTDRVSNNQDMGQSSLPLRSAKVDSRVFASLGTGPEP